MQRSPASFLPTADASDAARRACSPLAQGMEDSQIRAVAGEVWAMQAEGAEVCNLTIGDFAPAEFPVPEAYITRMTDEALAGQTNYTASDGIPELREAIAQVYARELGVDFGPEGVVVGGGARPVMYAAYGSFLSPGDGFAYGVPSWNPQYYVYLFGCRPLVMRGTPEARFLPSAEQAAAVLPEARLLILNSPLNPTGTAYRAEELQPVCEAILEENRRREQRGAPPVMLLYDQVYWTLTGPGLRHVHPLALVPELAPYTIYFDAISKSLAATGLRVGWAVLPPHLKKPMKALVGHTGGFAPRPEQRAAAWYLSQPELVLRDRRSMNERIRQRLGMLAEAMTAFKAEGLPVDLVPPEGGIYLSVRFDLHGRRSSSGQLLESNDQIRRHLLQQAGMAAVPFQAFGLEDETGWFRMSVGAVGMEQLAKGLERLRATLMEF